MTTILLREIQEKDVSTLQKLAKIPGFINLPKSEFDWIRRIKRSIHSFDGTIKDVKKRKFIFVAEDLTKKTVVGTSMIASQHGSVKSPHFYFKVGSEKRYSKSINTGFIHGTLTLKSATNGPSEIGGLLVDRRYQHDISKIGRQISFIRFLFLAKNRKLFKKQIIAELLPPLNKKKLSPLWEAVGRRFTNMDYWEADSLCQQDKEFILSLFPAGKIYASFLPAEARNSIGKVGKETEPVVHMLTRIGFKYTNHVDPFDGGPHYWADINELSPVKGTRAFRYRKGNTKKESKTVPGLICRSQQKLGCFRAVHADAVLSGKSLSTPELPEDAFEVLGIKEGDLVTFMPYY